MSRRQCLENTVFENARNDPGAIHIYIYIYIYIYMYLYLYLYPYHSISISICVCVCLCASVSMSVYLCACVRVRPMQLLNEVIIMGNHGLLRTSQQDSIGFPFYNDISDTVCISSKCRARKMRKSIVRCKA